MQVLTVLDSDAHMHAFDVSTPEKEFEVLKCLAEDLINSPLICDLERVELNKAIESGESKRIYNSLNNGMNTPGFDRSRGGKMYIVEVKTDWTPNLGCKITE